MLSYSRRAEGVAIIVGPYGEIKELKTVTCCHCSRIVHVKSLCDGVGRIEAREMTEAFMLPRTNETHVCHMCMALVCDECHAAGVCTPFEHKLEQQKHRGISLRSMGMAAALLLAFLLSCGATFAQTVANFDTPSCSGNGVGVYQGIDFSLSPWDCEKFSTLPGDATETISFYQNISTGKFRFLQPSILTSLRGGGSNGPGIFTITTDAGETWSQNLPKGVTLIQTGFTKPASVITIYYQGWWTIEVDDITYTTPLPATLVRARFTFDDATAVAGKVQVFQISASSAAPVSLGSFALDPTGLVSANLPLDPNSQYHAQLFDPTGAALQDFWSVNTSASLAASAIAALPKLELDVVLFKSTRAVKSVAAVPVG